MTKHALLGALALLLTPALAHAQESDDVGSLRLGAYLALGFGGELESTAGDFSSESDLDPTVGFGIRAEVPLHDYFVIGGIFELLTFEPDDWSERESVFDIDLWLKGRYPIELDDDIVLEPYLGIPFGLTLAVLPAPNDASEDDTWPGFNVGVLAGLGILVDQFGAFIELGWRHHQVFNEADVPFIGEVDWNMTANQFALHLGGMVAF